MIITIKELDSENIELPNISMNWKIPI